MILRLNTHRERVSIYLDENETLLLAPLLFFFDTGVMFYCICSLVKSMHATLLLIHLGVPRGKFFFLKIFMLNTYQLLSLH